VGLKNLLLSCADCLEIWEPQIPGTLGPVQACNGIALPLALPLLTVNLRGVSQKVPGIYCLKAM